MAKSIVPWAPLVLVILALGIVALVLAGCPNPTVGAPAGSLSITLRNNLDSRTLLPPISMDAASFTVSGTGPAGATFSQATTAAAVTVTGFPSGIGA